MAYYGQGGQQQQQGGYGQPAAPPGQPDQNFLWSVFQR